MTLTDLVPTLDLCQQLKAAGFPQDTAIYWQRSTMHIDHPTSVHVKGDNEIGGIEDFFEDICAAPTAGELEEWLAVRGFSLETWYGTDSLYHIEQRGYVFRGDRPLVVKDAIHVAALVALVMDVAG